MLDIPIVFVLLVVFQLKHFLADYIWQGPYMLGKFKPGWGFVGPLSAHCAVHSLLTFQIAIMTTGALQLSASLAILDFLLHFIMDRVKASPRLMGRWKALSAKEFLIAQSEWTKEKYCKSSGGPLGDGGSGARLAKIEARFRSNTFFWRCLGFDQLFHHLTHYLIIYFILAYHP